MKQLSIFDQPDHTKIHQQHTQWKLFIDGASRNNPGPAGAGIYVLKDDKPFLKEGFFLGTKTNNQAEYLALLLGLHLLKQHAHPHDIVFITSDSLLLIKQLQGIYKVANTELKKLYTLALNMLETVHYECCHVLRAYNTEADKLANKGIDDVITVPPSFVDLLALYGILL